MAHMEPQIEYGAYFEIETTHGTEIVPADVVGRTCATAHEAFLNYLEGKPLDPDGEAELKHGWLGRLSAPGYLDCTAWSVYGSEQEAREALEEELDG